MIRATILAWLLATTASAHGWYDPACCSGQDCMAVPVNSITPTPDGWLVDIQPGEHPLVSHRLTQIVPYDDRKARVSQDQDFHACVGKHTQSLFCIYTPPMGF